MSQIDPKALFKLSYGLYVIGSINKGQLNGQIANTVFQISSEPLTVAISINKNNLTNQFIKESNVFSISVLSKETPLEFIGHFGFKSGRNIDKYKNISYRIGSKGVPILSEHIVSSIEAEVITSYEVETHTVFIGKVTNAEVLNNDEPMTYAYYHQLKRGVVPEQKTVPKQAIGEALEQGTKEQGTKEQAAEKNSKYQCSVCGYIYDPQVGDPENGISPRAFADLPEDWVCPVCGVAKDQFEAI